MNWDATRATFVIAMGLMFVALATVGIVVGTVVCIWRLS